MRKRYVALAGMLVLAACSKPDNAPGPGGVTMGEARALDDAAAMLDARQPPLGQATSVPENEASAVAASPPATVPIH